MKVFDYQCPRCGLLKEDLLVTEKEENDLFCGECSALYDGEDIRMEKLIGAPRQFTTITPTYPGSKRHKAGYQHQFVNRPATKTQVGVGGGISKGTD